MHEKTSYTIKGLKYILIILLAVWCILYGIPAGLLSIAPVREKVKEKAVAELSQLLNVPVHIGKAGFKWPYRLALEDVSLRDGDGQTIFQTRRLMADLKVFPLLRGQFVFTTIRLFDLSLLLNRETPHSPLNIQPIIDAFAKRDTARKSSNVDLSIHSVLIRRGSLSYNVQSEPATPGVFNAQHIEVTGLNGHVALNVINADSINARIKRLSLTESSGFALKNLSLQLTGNKDSASMKDFTLELPQTTLLIRHAGLNFSEAGAAEDIINRMPVAFSMAPSEISPHDFAPFLPALAHFTDKVKLSAEADGTINDFNLRELSVSSGEKLSFTGKMSMKGISRPSEAYLFGEVSRMYISTEGIRNMLNNFNAAPVVLPAAIERLGAVHFAGNVSGFFDNLVAYGKLTSSIGSIETDILIGNNKEKNINAFVRGRVSSSELLISELFEEGNSFGITRFDMSIDATWPAYKPFAATIAARVSEFDYRNYRYENLQLTGRIQPNGFEGRFILDDPNGSLTADGIFLHSPAYSEFDFSAKLSHIKLDHLNLWDKLEEPDISASIRADFRGSNMDDLDGNISIDSLDIRTAPSNFFLRNLTLAASSNKAEKRLAIASSIVNGELSGVYSFATLWPGFRQTLKGYLPALAGSASKEQDAGENNLSFLLTLENTGSLSNTLKLPAGITKKTKLTGYYNSSANKFRIEADIPELTAGKNLVENCRLVCENPEGHIALHLAATGISRGVQNDIDFTATAADNRIESLFHWGNNKEHRFEATVSATTGFSEEQIPGNGLHTGIHIHKSPLILNDSVWQIHEAYINIYKGRASIDSFSLSHNEQSLRIDGSISNDLRDTLYLSLKQMELEYVFNILNIPVLDFSGEATGLFKASDLYRSHMIKTDRLHVKGFTFNKADLGDLNLSSRWDEEKQGILLEGNITEGDSAQTKVDGYIFPVGKGAGLDLAFDARNLNLGFLQKFMEGSITGFKGRGTGHVRLYGNFSDVNLEGRAFAHPVGIGVEFLNTYYTLSDSVYLNPGHIFLRDATLFDEYGNPAKVRAANLRHRFLHDLEFDASITDMAGILAYNASERQNPMLYGKAFASGTVNIQGNEKLINFDVNLHSEPKTLLGLNFMGNPTASTHKFITFANEHKPGTPAGETGSPSQKPDDGEDNTGTELRMKFTIDVTPDANIEIMMDPVAGDKIKGTGAGSLQIDYGTNTDLKVYGAVNIQKGDYNFSIQQLIHKNFQIREGSAVVFSGDPGMAELNINAVHNLTANLGDLDPSLLAESPRTSIPVNCVLLINGPFQHPAISFDLELPGTNPDLERKVRSYINTDDMLTRQIIYLLVLNTFHPSSFGQAFRPSEFNALTSAAISSQLSSLLNTITDKVQIGTNIRASQESFNETEVEMLLSSQLFDNRLLFNGNFGYKNNPNVKNVFVGEFDIEYLLTPTGEFRLKAYNHANDMYRYLKQSLTTQGFGFLYKKDFSRFRDLFGRKPKPVTIQPEAGNSPPTN
ncbi:DUF490 domain-containing protein [Bacteroidia bacterium]|nr:DUF490 domain-containing protein [Bacteroidia bacterium]